MYACMTVVVLVLRVRAQHSTQCAHRTVCVLKRMGGCRIKIIVDYQLQAAAHDGRGAVEAWGRKFSEIHLQRNLGRRGRFGTRDLGAVW